MKIHFISCALAAMAILVLFGKGYSQTPLGIKGGIQTANLSRESSTLGNEIPGFMIGMFFHPVNKHPITGEFEILITRKGSENFATTYLQVPILVNVKIADRFFLGLGAYGAANIGGVDDVNYQFLDFGYIAELGYWKERIELGLRFEKALSNSFSLDFFNFKNRVWALYLGYHL